ncbi:MAG: T9SS type A sorting domain-containing protein, partial [Raineya sp.]
STLDTPFNIDAPDQIENYMDYSADVCMNMFTRQQVDRMRIVLLNSPRRKELIGNTLFSIFGANVIAGFQGLQVTFTNQSGVTGTEPPITSWSWNFDASTTPVGGVSPATYTATSLATANPPIVTFNNIGTYRVTLSVTNGSKTDVSEMLIFVRQAPLQAPTNLIVVNQQGTTPNFFANDEIQLQWNDNSNDEDNFVLTRRKATEPVSQTITIATLPPNTTTYTDTDAALEDDIEYIYQVRSVRGTETANSNTRRIRFKKSVTALDDTPLAREVRIYPNPTQSSFNVDLSGLQVSSAKLQLHNTIGQVVAQKVMAGGEVNFDVQNLPKGMYLLKIDTDKGA